MIRLVTDPRAATSVLVAAALPMLMGLAALAVDLGMIQLETRRMQGIADASALAAARDLDAAEAGARAMVAANAGGEAITLGTRIGRYSPDAGVAADTRFVAGHADADAVRVSLARDVPTAFARVFGVDHVRVTRHATAARLDLASLSIGSRLAAVDGGVLNAMLSALTGSSVSLSVLDYRALASAQVDLAGFLGALRTEAGIRVGTYDELLATQVTGNQLLRALATQVADPAARGALLALAAAARGSTRLDGLIDLGALGSQADGGGGLVRLNALELASNLLQATATRRQFALDLGAGLPGLASTRATVAIGERPAQSPWISVTRRGEPIVRTAQARIYLETKLAPRALPGLSLVSVELPLLVELASAEARLDRLRCADPRSATVQARSSPGLAAIARVDRNQLSDFTRPLARSPARLVEAVLVRVDGSATVDLGAGEAWRDLVFDATMIAAGTPHTIRAAAPTGSVAASLLGGIDLDAQLVGFLPLPLDPITDALGGQLSLLAPVLDPLLASLTGALGVGIGEADVRITGLRCGQPVLVQ